MEEGKKIQYAVVGDYVFSQDGDRHFIPANQLCDLYGLNPMAKNVHLYDSRRLEDRRQYLAVSIATVTLWPRSDGKYHLP